jgi:hypothetical protein
VTEREDTWAGVDLAELLGGRRGIADATAPGVVLVVVAAVAPLGWAIAAACLAAAGVAALRRLRGQPLRQVVMGLGGIAVAATLAAVTGQAKHYFLPGILLNAAYAVVAAASIAARRPLLGYVAALLDRGYGHWQHDPGLRRAATWATVVWAAIFATRAAVQGYLYVHDSIGWLAPTKLVLGLPLYAAGVASTLLLLEGRRVEPAPADAG